MSWTIARSGDLPAAREKDQAPSAQAAGEWSGDTLIVSGQLDRISPSLGGGGGSLDWTHSSPRQRTLTLGVASYALAGSRWTFGSVGGVLRPRERLTIHGQASAGGGRSPASSFAYQIYSGDLNYRVSKRLFASFGDRYFSIAGVHGHLRRRA